MALPTNPIDGQYVRPSGNVLYKYSASDNSYRTFNPEGEYVSIVDYSYRYKNSGGSISAPYLDNDDVLTIEFPYNFKQEIYTPSNVGGQFTITLPQSIAASSGIPTVDGSVLVRELPTNFWTTQASWNLSAIKGELAGVGTQSASLAFGGASFGTRTAVTEKFDGSSWTTNGAWDLPFTLRLMTGAGTQNAALSIGGNEGNYIASTFKFDGSSWTSNATWDLNATRGIQGSCGIQNSALTFGGFDGSITVNTTEKFDGSTWTVNAGWNLNTARDYLGGNGEQNAALAVSGEDSGGSAINSVEKFDGSSWSLTGSLNSARSAAASIGEQNSALSFGGSIASSESFDGSSWSIRAELSDIRNSMAGSGNVEAGLCFGGTISSFTDITEKYISSSEKILALYNKGQNNVDYPFGTAITISGDQLVIADSLSTSTIPEFEVSYISIAREREGITIFADFDIKNLDEATEDIEIAKIYNSIFPDHYASIVYNKNTAFYTINYSNYDSSIDDYSTGSAISSAPRDLVDAVAEVRIKDFFDTAWSTNLDLYADREEDVFDSASPDNLFYDTIEVLSGARFIIGDVAVAYGDSSRIDVLSEDVAYEDVQPDVYYEIKDGGEYILETTNSVNYTIINTGNVLDGYWAVGAGLNTARRELAGAGTQNAALSFGGTTGSVSAVTEKFDGSSWGTQAGWDLNAARISLAGAGEQNAALSFGGTSASSAVTEKFDGNSWTTTEDLIAPKNYSAGAGEQNAALNFGGYIIGSGNLATTEKFDGSSWSTQASWDLNIARRELAGAGTQNAALSFGGTTGSGTVLATTEKFDGSSWSTQTGWDLNAARRKLAGAGEQNAALSFGGTDTGSDLAITEKFDGSSWTTTGSLNTAKWGLAGAGTQNAALSFGGDSGGISAVTEKFQNENSIRIIRENNIDIVEDEIEYNDASVIIQVIRNNSFDSGSWTITGDLNNARNSLAGAGTQNAALSFGGGDGTSSAVTEKFDGNSWSTQAGWDLNTARFALAGAGTQNAALSFGGSPAGAVTEKFDGSTWSYTTNMNDARFGLAGAGTQNAALSFGGGTPSKAITEKFDGSSWSTQAGWDLNTARESLAGTGTQNATLSFGGDAASDSAVTEKFDGSSWSTQANWNLNAARRFLAGVGEQNAALSFGGNDGGDLAITEKFNGSFWSTQASWDLNIAKRASAGAGEQNAALSFGGYDGSSYLSTTEKFDYTPEVSAILTY